MCIPLQYTSLSFPTVTKQTEVLRKWLSQAKINTKSSIMNTVYKEITEICNPHFAPLNTAEYGKMRKILPS